MDDKFLVIIDAALDNKTGELLKSVLRENVQFVHSTEAWEVLALLPGIQFQAVAILSHGPDIPAWLYQERMVGAVNQVLCPGGQLDILSCNVHPADLRLQVLHQAYAGHNVNASSNITGIDGDWLLEYHTLDDGNVALYSDTDKRNMSDLYFRTGVRELRLNLWGFLKNIVNIDRFFDSGVKA